MESSIQLLKEQFGSEFNSNAVRSVAEQVGVSYATLSKKLVDYKVGRGKVESGSDPRKSSRT